MSRPEARIDALQWLRALAAGMVLVGHVLEEAAHYRGMGAEVAAGLPWTRGVDVFFVISGVVIALSAARWDGSPGGFLWRRVLRVVPLYWLFTTLMVVALVVVPGGVKETELEPGQIVASYLFLPWERHDGRIAPVLSLGWTLNYEMFFYLLAAGALVWRWPRMGWVVVGLLGAVALAGAVLRPEGVAARFWTNAIILEFAFGIGIASVLRRWGAVHRPALALAVFGAGLAALVLLHGTGLPRFLAAGLPAAAMVAGPVLFLRTEARGWIGALGLRLGDASYALYLSHRFVLRLATLALLPLVPEGGLWLFVGGVTLAATLVALAVFAWIERPLLARLQPPRRAAAA
jgi:exopolysaccharide production protein ExoZ